MNYELKKINDVSVFKLNEKRLDKSISGLLKGEFTIILHAEDVKKLVIDLSEVDSCDSSGLSAILLAYRIMQSNQGALRLAALTKNVIKLIEISQLNRALPVCNTVNEAIAELDKL
jgi:anti-anti-sigma factor